MAYQIRQRRSVVPIEFPALCSSVIAKPALDFSKLSFEDDEPEVKEKGLEHGWLRMYFVNHRAVMETDYVHPEPSLDVLAGKAILKMKARWVKFYTDRDLEPYDYDYIPPEDDDYETASSSSWSAEDPEDAFSD